MTESTRTLAVEIGRRLRAARTRASLKQNEAAALIPGLTPTRLSNYEKGLRTLDIEIAKRLAAVYGVSAAYLLTLEDAPVDSGLAWLVELYRRADDRGRQAIVRLAEYEAGMSESCHVEPAAADAAGAQRVHESTPENYLPPAGTDQNPA
jgi:transcriptional regulator with XRE-family HTH domain